MTVYKKISIWIMFLMVVYCIVYINSNISKAERKNYPEVDTIYALNKNSHSIFFLGSSRIKHSVDVKFIQDSLKDSKIFNLGISGSSFVQSFYLFEYLKNIKGKKIFFIELTSYHETFSPSFVEAVQLLNIPNFPASYFSIFTPSINSSLPQAINLSETLFWNRLTIIQNRIKNILTPSREVVPDVLGFRFVSENNYLSENSFLTINDLKKYSIHKVNTRMLDMVLNLIKNEKKFNYEVFFLLPLTTIKKDELANYIPLYNRIPMESKVIYDSIFLSKIRNSKYLFDKNHFNIYGAKVYSTFLINKSYVYQR